MDAKPRIASSIFFGFVFSLYAIVGLWRTEVAYHHHTFFRWVGNRPGRAWMDPWQGVIAFGLSFMLGLWLIGNALYRRHKWRQVDSALKSHLTRR